MIPVVLIHKGMHEYVQYTLKQANKKNEVHLLGDTAPNIEDINFYSINSLLDDDSKKFTDSYLHLNTTPLDYEIFCYLRWFALKKFMLENNIDTVFYIDSDVLLFPDVNEEWFKFNQYELTLLHRTAAVSSFITINALQNFCSMISQIYSNKKGYDFEKIKSHFNVRQKHQLAGGVCDMTFFEYFHYNASFGGGPGRVGEMMQIINDSTYDHNINAEDQDFEFENNLKRLQIINKEPFVFNNKLNKNIKFNSIHCQGSAKSLIKHIYQQCEN